MNFTVVERLVVLNVLDAEGQKGSSLQDLSKMLKLVDKLKMTEEEVKFYNLRLEDKAWKWSTKDEDGKDLPDGKEIELSDDQNDKLKEILKKRSEAKEVKMTEAGPLLTLAEKIGLDL